MNRLAESKNYLITNEYEKVFLNFKNTDKSVLIGEFYGDPDIAIISKDETFCVVGGEGVIVYYLNSPFSEYDSDIKSSKQWVEWGRDNGKNVIWVEHIQEIGNRLIEITTEKMEKNLIYV